MGPKFGAKGMLKIEELDNTTCMRENAEMNKGQIMVVQSLE